MGVVDAKGDTHFEPLLAPFKPLKRQLKLKQMCCRCFGVGGTCPVQVWRCRILFTTCTPGRELPISVLMSGKLSGNSWTMTWYPKILQVYVTVCLCWRCTRAGTTSDPDVVLLCWAFRVHGDLILIYYWGGLRSAAPMGSGSCSAVLRPLWVASAMVCN